jgi:SAM-dependent methyltransferase
MKNKISEIAVFLEAVCRDSKYPTARFWREYWLDTGHYKRLLQMIRVLDPVLQQKPVLLDIGSFGEFPLILRKFYGFPIVHATSMEGDFIGYGKGQLRERDDPDIEISFIIEQCDVERKRLSLRSQSVDMVTCFEVLEHLRYDPMFMMLEIHRVLRNDGRLILSTPNVGSWESLTRIAQHKSPFIFSSYFSDGSGIGHCKEYSAAEIRLLFENSGFALEKFETFDSATQGGLTRKLGKIRKRLLEWDEDLRGQTFLVHARKSGRPRMRKYVPLYTADVPHSEDADTAESLTATASQECMPAQFFPELPSLRQMESQSSPASDKQPVPILPNIGNRFGNGDASLLDIDLLDENMHSTREVLGGQRVVLRVSARFNCDVDQPIIGYTLRDRNGMDLSACNTSYAEQYLPPARCGQIITSDFSFRMPQLANGSYSISPAVARGTLLQHEMCDWMDGALVFELQSPTMVYGMFKMDVEVKSCVS